MERDLVVSPWTPDASMPNDDKRIDDAIVWAALDCTSYFPHYGAVAVLGRLHSKLIREARVGERYVAVGWKIGGEGRKLWSGSAVFDEDGNPCALGSATWITLKTEQADFKVAHQKRTRGDPALERRGGRRARFGVRSCTSPK